MEVRSIAGDTALDVLYRYRQSDDDPLEKQLYQLNPHLVYLGPILPAGTVIQLPPIKLNKVNKLNNVIKVWD
ncbi:tail protein X [Spartinivicinus ruber]|uniref:tail protein X n=1 Tax=Spartinivicinus ruber TaxID=2683272 RepID=UPI0013D0AC25|nr:tail protein X [Spartinivicinus ruber]